MPPLPRLWQGRPPSGAAVRIVATFVVVFILILYLSSPGPTKSPQIGEQLPGLERTYQTYESDEVVDELARVQPEDEFDVDEESPEEDEGWKAPPQNHYVEGDEAPKWANYGASKMQQDEEAKGELQAGVPSAPTFGDPETEGDDSEASVARVEEPLPPPHPLDGCDTLPNLVANVFTCPGQPPKKVRQHAYVTFEKSGSSTIHAFLALKTNFTYRMGFDKRVRFNSWPLKERLSHETVSANCFGIHNNAQMENVPIKYSLLIREPVSRTISEYWYRQKFEPWAPNRVKPGETLLSHSAVHSNYAVKRLALFQDCFWTNNSNLFFDCVTHRKDSDLQRGLEAVVSNLRRWFAVVGLLERFNETLVLYSYAMDQTWDPCTMAVNAHADLYANEEITPLQLDMLADYNRYDVALYRAVQTLFEEQIREAEKNPEIKHWLELARKGELPVCPFWTPRKKRPPPKPTAVPAQDMEHWRPPLEEDEEDQAPPQAAPQAPQAAPQGDATPATQQQPEDEVPRDVEVETTKARTQVIEGQAEPQTHSPPESHRSRLRLGSKPQ